MGRRRWDGGAAMNRLGYDECLATNKGLGCVAMLGVMIEYQSVRDHLQQRR